MSVLPFGEVAALYAISPMRVCFEVVVLNSEGEKLKEEFHTLITVVGRGYIMGLYRGSDCFILRGVLGLMSAVPIYSLCVVP